MKTEFESRISFHKIKMRSSNRTVYEASVYWGDTLYETIKVTKELCIEDLKLKANIKE